MRRVDWADAAGSPLTLGRSLPTSVWSQNTGNSDKGGPSEPPPVSSRSTRPPPGGKGTGNEASGRTDALPGEKAKSMARPVRQFLLCFQAQKQASRFAGLFSIQGYLGDQARRRAGSCRHEAGRLIRAHSFVQPEHVCQAPAHTSLHKTQTCKLTGQAALPCGWPHARRGGREPRRDRHGNAGRSSRVISAVDRTRR